MIKGIHHVSMKASTPEQYETAKHFYNSVLNLPVVHEWPEGVMFDTGNGYVEIFNTGKEDLPMGVIRHFAFATDHVDELVEITRKLGHKVIIEPRDVTLMSDPPFPIRIAFIEGPLGEEIELLKEYR